MLQNIFVVKNHTLKEIHFGQTKGRVRSQISDLRHHRSHQAAHWDWHTQDIECQVLSRHIPLPLAALRVWRLKHKLPHGWKAL